MNANTSRKESYAPISRELPLRGKFAPRTKHFAIIPSTPTSGYFFRSLRKRDSLSVSFFLRSWCRTRYEIAQNGDMNFNLNLTQEKIDNGNK